MSKINKKQLFANIAAILLLPAGAFFTTFSEFPPGADLISAASLIIFALPTFWTLRWWIGYRKAFVLFSILAVFSILIEAAAIITGFPYGHFGYSHLLGFKLFGIVPWTVAFAWPPLILGAFAIANQFTDNRIQRIFGTAVIATLFDLVLDPGAVSLNFWQYHEGGFFYGVPLSNFAGWLFSASAGAAILEIFIYFFRPLLPVPMQMAISSLFIVYFWTWINLWNGIYIPVLIGFLIAAAVTFLILNRRYSFDDKIVFADEDGKPVDTGDKEESHNAHTRLHLAFSIFIFDSRGRLLLQQRSFSKKTWPGVWSNSCCGHLRLNETAADAARRRLRQELGIRNVRLICLLRDFRYTAEKDGIVENEICPVFVGRYEGKIKPEKEEIAATEWRDWKTIYQEVAAGVSDLSPWAQLEIRKLAELPEFKNFLNQGRQ